MRAAGWGRPPRTPVPVARLLLLALVVLGVIQMHSVGHEAHHDSGAGLPMTAGHAAGPSVPPPAQPEPGHPTEVSADLLGMCLAILTSLGLLGALTALLAARAQAGRGPRDGGPLAILLAGRGPPAALPTGRRLASLSVLRI